MAGAATPPGVTFCSRPRIPLPIHTHSMIRIPDCMELLEHTYIMSPSRVDSSVESSLPESPRPPLPHTLRTTHAARRNSRSV
jgi:hypothetical protein